MYSQDILRRRIANVHEMLGEYDLALLEYKILKENLGTRNPNESYILDDAIAEIYFKQGDLLKAKSLSEEILPAIIQNEDNIGQAHIYLKLAKIESSLGNIHQSKSYINKVNQLIPEATNSKLKGFFVLKEAKILDSNNEIEQAHFLTLTSEILLGDTITNEERLDVMAIKEHYLVHKAMWQESYLMSQQHLKLSNKLNFDMGKQRTLRIRTEFNFSQKAADNEKLNAIAALKSKEIHLLKERQTWQFIAVALSLILLSILAILLFKLYYRAKDLSKLALTDELTGLSNRRSIERFLKKSLQESCVNSTPLSIFIFDIDNFKRVNDNYGHDIGDKVLKQVANACMAAVRGADNIGRIGGEEFLVVLPKTELKEALNIAERVRKAVAALEFSELDSNITISSGLTQRRNELDISVLIKGADEKLYQAKESGKNKVCC